MLSLLGGSPWFPWSSPSIRPRRRCTPCEEVQRQAVVLAESQQHAARTSARRRLSQGTAGIGRPVSKPRHLAGVAIYNAKGQPLAITPGLARPDCPRERRPPSPAPCGRAASAANSSALQGGADAHPGAAADADGRLLGAIAVFHNVAFICGAGLAACADQRRADAADRRHDAADRPLESGKAPAAHGAVAARSAHRECVRGRPAAQGRDLPAAHQRSDAAGHQPDTWRARRPKRKRACAMPPRPSGPPSGCASRCRAS